MTFFHGSMKTVLVELFYAFTRGDNRDIKKKNGTQPFWWQVKARHSIPTLEKSSHQCWSFLDCVKRQDVWHSKCRSTVNYFCTRLLIYDKPISLLFYLERDSLVESIMIHKSIIEAVQTACTFISRLLVFIEQLCVKFIIYWKSFPPVARLIYEWIIPTSFVNQIN